MLLWYSDKDWILYLNHVADIKVNVVRVKKKSILISIIVMVLLIFGIAGLAIIAIKYYENQYLDQVRSQLTSISKLKVAEIETWRSERITDAKYYFNNPFFSRAIEDYLKDGGTSETNAEISHWFAAIKNNPEYSEIFLLDSVGSLIIDISSVSQSSIEILLEDIQTAYQSKNILVKDFYRKSINDPICLSILVPVFSTDDESPLAVLVLTIDPQVYLYPLILNWPVPSETAETTLIRKQQERVQYLSELRFMPDAPLNEFIELSDQHRPSVQAITGAEGIIEGINYRGQEVIADVRPLPDSPWFLLSRIDKSEVFTPIKERSLWIIILAGLLITLVAFGFGLFLKQQRNAELLAEQKIQREVSETSRKLKEAQEMAHLGFWYWDIKSGKVEWSEEVFRIFGQDPSVFTPDINSIMALSPWPEDQQRDQELIQRAIQTHQPGRYEQKFLRLDQSIGYYSSTFQGLFDEEDQLVAIIGSVMDTTESTIKEIALRDSENRFKTLFKHAAIGVLIIDPNKHAILDVNQKFCDMLGYPRSEILKKSFIELTSPEFRDISLRKNEELALGKVKEYSFEKQYLRKDGQIVWGNVMVSSLWDEDEIGTKQQHIAVVNDITQQKKIEFALRESEKKFRETIANLDEGYFSASSDGILYDHNPAFSRIFGYPENQNLHGKSLSEFWQNPQDHASFIKKLNTQRSIHSIQVNSQKSTGERLILLASAHVIRNEENQPSRFEGIFLDITSRIDQEEKILAAQVELQRLLDETEQAKQALIKVVEEQKIAQEEIRQLNRTLEDRVAQRTAELKSSNEELESFAYSISHDLRAPLRAIDGYSNILEQDFAPVLNGEGLRLLSIVRNSTKNMDKMITDLLQLSRVGRSELKYSLIEMKDMAQSVFEELAPPENQQRIRFSVENIPNCRADPTLMRHVWINLISNAIKYSSPKETPAILITGKQENDFFTYTIKDNGVGFNPEFKEKLFGLFQRFHKATEFEGTGVGLAIVHRIIHRHGGKVWADGQPGVGAEFSFTLPK